MAASKKALGWVVVLAFVPMLAIAAQAYVNIEQRLTAEQQHASGIDTLSPEQLVVLNALLREDSERIVATEKRAIIAAQSQGQPRGQSFVGFDESPIKSRVKGKVDGWKPGTEFELENGQTWKVLKGSMTLRKSLESPEIIVVPGLAGRWFLQVDEDLPKARVYRID